MIPEPERLYGGTIALAEAELWITSIILYSTEAEIMAYSRHGCAARDPS